MSKQKEMLAAVEMVSSARRIPDLSVKTMIKIVIDIDERLQDPSVSIPDAFTRSLNVYVPGMSRVRIRERAAYRAALQEFTDEGQIAHRRSHH